MGCLKFFIFYMIFIHAACFAYFVGLHCSFSLLFQFFYILYFSKLKFNNNNNNNTNNRNHHHNNSDNNNCNHHNNSNNDSSNNTFSFRSIYALLWYVMLQCVQHMLKEHYWNIWSIYWLIFYHSCSVSYKLVMGTVLLEVNALIIHFCILDIKLSFSLFVFIFKTC